jgi:hypothetical protein
LAVNKLRYVLKNASETEQKLRKGSAIYIYIVLDGNKLIGFKRTNLGSE